jgi:protein-L-isoaspartate(D-aspartate) O-methyltransferase
MSIPFDSERARFNMIEQQIRTWEVLDQKVLDLLFKVRREDFVPEAHRALAFADLEIPLGHGETMLQPKLEARILQELEVAPSDRILEIGTGSGYMTALLASFGAHVYSVEIIEAFTRAATAKLAALGAAGHDTRHTM